MDDFSTPGEKNGYGVEPSESNMIQSGKRPQSSTAPSIFLDKDGVARLVIGASGGTKIATAISLVRGFALQVFFCQYSFRPITTHTHYPVSQSKLEANTCSWRKARENGRSNAKPNQMQIVFFIQVKAALRT